MKIYTNLISIIERGHISKFVTLALLMILGAFLEAFGISLIIPLVGTLLSDDFEIPNQILSFIPILAEISKEEMITYAVSAFVLFYFLKSIYLIFLVYVQSRYIYSIQQNISTRLYKTYLDQPYSFHLKRNSGEIISNTITESMQFALGLIGPIIYIITDILIILCISILLLYVEPIGALSVMTLFSLGACCLYLISKNRSAEWGEKRQQNEVIRIKSAQQGLNGIKEVKLHGFEDIFSEFFSKSTKISLNSGMKKTALQGVPKVFFELLTVLSISVLIYILFSSGMTPSELISTLGVFALAAFKLLPSVARLVTNIQALKFATPVINKIKNELKLESKILTKDTTAKLSFKKNISIKNLSFKYEDAENYALNDINIDIKAGQSIGIIGSSGAGKSTLVDSILGLLLLSKGNIKIDDVILDSNNLSSWQKNIGYVSQSIYLLDDTYKKNIGFGLSNQEIDESKLNNAIKLSQLDEFINTLPDGVNSSVGESGVRISGGQRQRIGIARALYKNPDLLVLDEATSALDNETEKNVMDSINNLKGNMTIIIIAHRLTTVKDCDVIVELDKGSIAKIGTPREIL